MIEIKTGHGKVLIEDRQSIFSYRIVIPIKQKHELWRELDFHMQQLRSQGKLSGMVWLVDDIEETDVFYSFTRRWGKEEATIFIPEYSLETE